MSRHSFDPDIAKLVGLNAAVIFQNLVWWCEKNAANGRNIHEENAWTYNSLPAFQRLFSYLSYAQIRGALAKLEDAGLIRAGNFNEQGRDQTKWYCITAKSHLSEITAHLSKLTDPSAKINRPLPDNKPDNKPDTPQTPQGASSLFSENELPKSESEASDDLKSEKEKPTKEKLDADFDQFWKAYPKKAGKPAARKAWDKAIKKDAPEIITAKAARYALWLKEPVKSGDFRPHAKHPQGWLNDERWLDPDLTDAKPISKFAKMAAGF